MHKFILQSITTVKLKTENHTVFKLQVEQKITEE